MGVSRGALVSKRTAKFVAFFPRAWPPQIGVFFVLSVRFFSAFSKLRPLFVIVSRSFFFLSAPTGKFKELESELTYVCAIPSG